MSVSDATDALCIAIDNALADSKIDASEAVTIAKGAFWDLHTAIAATGDDSEERKASWITAARAVYDKSLAPLDIPGVNNLIERLFVDPGLGKLVPAVVGWVFDKAEQGSGWLSAWLESAALDLFKAAKGE